MSRRWTLAALVLAVACVTFATWPVVSAPRSSMFCNYLHPDCISNHWLLIWIGDALAHGRSILHNDRYYWPVGDAPWLAGNGSEGFPYAVLHVLLGWPLAANVHLVGILVLNGLSGYALARASGATEPASLTAVPTTALLVFCVQELGAGRFSQVSICWLAFFLAAWLRLLDGRGGPVLPAVLLAVTSFFYWYFGFFGVLAGALLLLFRRPATRSLVVFGVTYLTLVAPLLFVFLHYWANIPGTTEVVFPHPEAIKDSTWPGIPFWDIGGRHAGRILPFTTCALALVGLLWRRDRVSWGLAAVALLFAGLMAGALVPHGPYELVYGLAEPLQRFWWPYRHVVVLNLALIALAARGASLLPRWAAVVVALSIPVQLAVQHAPWRPQFTLVKLPEPFYDGLADAPGTVLVEPPLSAAVASSQAQLLYQLFHRKQLLGGHALWVDRVRPPAWDAFVAENSFLTAMQRLERGELDGTFVFDPADLRALLDGGARTFTLNREYFPIQLKGLVEAYTEVFLGLFGQPTATGRRVKAWDGGQWNGTFEVHFTPYAWPGGLRPGDGTLGIQGMHAESLVFSIPR